MVVVVDVAEAYAIGRLIAGLVAISGVLNISNIIQFFDCDRSSSLSQLIKGQSEDLQRLLKYFNGAINSGLIFYY